MRRRALLVVSALLLGACGSDGRETAPDETVTVLAAASLTEAFTAVGTAFEDSHPGITVSFNFAGSSALAQQILDGAPADVFASADEANMQKVVEGGKASGPTVIARNRLSLIVETGNPKGVGGLADLGNPGVVFVLCAPEVPCGKYGAAALTKAGVTATPASLEENVKAVVTKVTFGEADAGIVYVTDVQAAADEAEGVAIDIADDPDLEAAYPMTAVTESDAVQAWIDFVLSEDGQAILRTYGFVAP